MLLSVCLALTMLPVGALVAFAAPAGNTVHSFTIDGYDKTIYYIIDPASISTSTESNDEYAHAHISGDGIEGTVDAVRIDTTNVYYYIPGVTTASKAEQPDLGTFYGSSKMSWLEYWQNEGLTPSTLTEASSSVPDGESGGHAGSLAGGGYLDLGAFDAVSRPTVTYGISHFSYQYIQYFNGLKGTGTANEFEADDPPVENRSYFAQRTPAIGGEGDGNTLVGEVTAWTAGATVGGIYKTASTGEDTFYMETYDVTGFQRIPVKVDGKTYLEQRVLNEAESSAAKPAFKNFTIGGTDGAGNEVTASTGGLKTLNTNGTYSKQTAGVRVGGDPVEATGTSVAFQGNQWGSYADAFITLDASFYGDYIYKFLAAKYEFYGETITDGSGNAIAKDQVTLASVAGKTPLAAYGTKTGADFWYRPANKNPRLELGFNFDALRFGGDGTSTTVGDIYNKGNAEGKTGWYKIILYAPGYNDIETMVYIPWQVTPPALSASTDGTKLYLVGIESALRAELAAGTASVRLIIPGGRGTPEELIADLTERPLAADGSYDISDIVSTLDPEKNYSLSIAGETFAPLTVALPAVALTAGSSISVDPAELELSVGDSTALVANANPAPTAEAPVVWNVADSSIASVNATGRVTGVAAGTTIVYATANGRTATCTVTVLPTGTGTISRHDGATRLETAVKASIGAFPDPSRVDAVIVAFSGNYPDALAASTLAGCVNGPILLSDTADISAITLDEINRLAPSTVYIVGGELAVSNAVKQRIEALSGKPTVERLGGDNRFETARLIADKAVELGARTDEMYLATGGGFADALAVSSFAASQKVPILLTDSRSLSAETAAYIQSKKPSKVFVIGGTAVISDNVLTAAGNAAAVSASAERIAGNDRYLTAQAVVNRLIPYYDLRPIVIGIATGEAFPDALSGGAALGARGGVLSLTHPNNLMPSAADTIGMCKRYKPSVEILGGTSAISAQIADAVESMLTQ